MHFVCEENRRYCRVNICYTFILRALHTYVIKNCSAISKHALKLDYIYKIWKTLTTEKQLVKVGDTNDQHDSKSN